jgi:hypothetical protein
MRIVEREQGRSERRIWCSIIELEAIGCGLFLIQMEQHKKIRGQARRAPPAYHEILCAAPIAAAA